ncbi:MAG: ribosome-associated translation inhibitor RaiA [Eubacteriales bacterium]
MNIIIHGKQIKVTNALKDYVIKRVSKLERFSDEFIDVQVTLSVEKERQRVEVTAPLNGVILRGEEEKEDMYSAIDLVVEKLERQLMKYRTKIGKRRSKALKESEESNLSETEYEFQEDNIVRVKHFNTKPMSVDEAVMQMNLIGHSFFVFTNDVTERINVVYKRKSGNYGVLDPE